MEQNDQTIQGIGRTTSYVQTDSFIINSLELTTFELSQLNFSKPKARAII